MDDETLKEWFVLTEWTSQMEIDLQEENEYLLVKTVIGFVFLMLILLWRCLYAGSTWTTGKPGFIWQSGRRV